MHGPTVHLVRHGRTAWNNERRFLGKTDVPLDAIGQAQATRLATALGPIGRVVSSPLSRARATAERLGSPALHPGLAEMDMGELEGLPAEVLLERYPAVLAAWRADPSEVVIPGGETMAQVQERAVAAWREIRAGLPDDPALRVAVVSHQLAIATILCALTGAPLRDFRRFSQRNTAWATLRLLPDGGVDVLAVDQAPHLDGWDETVG